MRFAAYMAVSFIVFFSSSYSFGSILYEAWPEGKDTSRVGR